MANVYEEWFQGHKADFIYLSAGPCRYEPRLKRELKSWCFPDGAIVFRKGGPLFPPRDYKTRAIQQIVEKKPGDHFILVGDSGEYDPECYGELAREYPKQIERIFIREISGECLDSPRYVWDFRSLPTNKCKLFTSSSELPKLE